MIVYKDEEYDSKAAVVRAMYHNGDMDDSPEQKKRVAALLGMTVQTVHATLIKMVKPIGAPAPIAKPQVVRFTDNFADVRKAVEDRYNDCYEIAKSKGYDLPKIDIRWDLKGRVAGQFCWRMEYYWFNVNLVLAKENLEDYLAQTVPHEFSHYIAHTNWKKSGGTYKRPPSHGWEWKRIMLNVFKREPERCHSYDTTSVARKTNRFEYTCGCMKHFLTSMRHRKLQIYSRQYRCAKCKSYLTFVKAL
jgi:SprT protein